MTDAGRLVYQTLISEHEGRTDHALQDLSERFARISIELHNADLKRSYAYSRELAPPTFGVLDDVPAAVDDTWITTGREA